MLKNDYLFSVLAALLIMTATPAMAGKNKAAGCSPNFNDYPIDIWTATSPPNMDADPSVTVYPPSTGGYKVLGGGAIVHTLPVTAPTTGQAQPGNAFLTASYPDLDGTQPVGWVATSKHQGAGTRARITAYAIAIKDPSNCWDVQAFQQATSTAVAHPSATVTLGAGYVLTGGGAQATPQVSGGNGSFLFSSIPYASSGNTYNGWSAQSKDQGTPDIANITAFAIGIKAAGAGVNTPTSNAIAGKPSTSLNNPMAVANGSSSVQPGVNCTMTGGGAHDNWGSAAGGDWGNLLTAIYPAGTTGWLAFAQSSGVDDAAVLTAYVVCLN